MSKESIQCQCIDKTCMSTILGRWIDYKNGGKLHVETRIEDCPIKFNREVNNSFRTNL